MICALVFDFDCLILNTEEPVYESWKALYRQYGQDFSLAEWGQYIGLKQGSFDPLEALVRRLKSPINRQAAAAQRSQHELDLIERQPILPGVLALLQRARQLGLKLGVASSSSCDWVAGHLERRGLIHYFDAIRTGDEVAHAKPSPEVYLAVLNDLQATASQAIAFEDSPNGVLAAQKAGLLVVAVPNPLTSQLAFPPVDLKLDSLADITLDELIRQLDRPA